MNDHIFDLPTGERVIVGRSTVRCIVNAHGPKAVHAHVIVGPNGLADFERVGVLTDSGIDMVIPLRRPPAGVRAGSPFARAALRALGLAREVAGGLS